MLENSFYRVDIAGAGFTGTAPADGFIDGRNMQQYAETSWLDPANSGTGYHVGDVLSDGQGHTVTVETVDGSGKILTYTSSIGLTTQVNDSPTMTGGAGSGAAFKFGGYPLDLATSTARARGNVRYRMMLDQIQLMANAYACNFDYYATVGTTSLTLYFERDEFVMTPDETTPGITLFGVAAVERCIARSMLKSKTTLRDVYDPTPSVGIQNTTSLARNPVIVSDVVAAPLVASTGNLATDLATAAAAITVTKLPFVDVAT